MDLTQKEEVVEWLDSLNNSISSGEISGPSFLKPFHFVTLALMAKKEQFKEKFEEIVLPEGLSDYAERMGLWEAAGMEPPNRVRSRHSTDTIMPVFALKDRQQINDRIKDFKVLFDIENNPDKKDILIVLSELLENCYAHSRVNEDLHGLVCAQQWQRGNLGQIAICDLGIGVRKSLSENESLHPQLKEKNACVLACEYGVTSKPHSDQHHSGYGLTLTKDILIGNGGKLIVVSNKEIAWLNNAPRTSLMNHDIVSTMSGSLLQNSWPGTLIVFEWKINRPLDALAVYKSWPKSEEGDDDEDFF